MTDEEKKYLDECYRKIFENAKDATETYVNIRKIMEFYKKCVKEDLENGDLDQIKCGEAGRGDVG